MRTVYTKLSDGPTIVGERQQSTGSINSGESSHRIPMTISVNKTGAKSGTPTTTLATAQAAPTVTPTPESPTAGMRSTSNRFSNAPPSPSAANRPQIVVHQPQIAVKVPIYTTHNTGETTRAVNGARRLVLPREMSDISVEPPSPASSTKSVPPPPPPPPRSPSVHAPPPPPPRPMRDSGSTQSSPARPIPAANLPPTTTTNSTSEKALPAPVPSAVAAALEDSRLKLLPPPPIKVNMPLPPSPPRQRPPPPPSPPARTRDRSSTETTFALPDCSASATTSGDSTASREDATGPPTYTPSYTPVVIKEPAKPVMRTSLLAGLASVTLKKVDNTSTPSSPVKSDSGANSVLNVLKAQIDKRREYINESSDESDEDSDDGFSSDDD